MRILDDLKALNGDQRAAFLASVLGWTLDAFDFFLMVFMIKAIAHDFQVEKEAVSYAVFLTLACRPIGALLFGWLADRFGRRPILVIVVLLFSFFELASAFATNLTELLILRALFGVAMGGEWGIGASLVMESIPERCRGTVSGVLQQGYPLGYLLASVVYGLFFDSIGWRGMFMIGVLPAALVFYIRMGVKESPAWEKRREHVHYLDVPKALFRHWPIFVYVVLLMTAFNLFSHGTQDLYPTFLQVQHKLDTHTVSAILIVMNIGAIIGGLTFGSWSQRIGRRRAIIISTLLALPILPIWAFSTTPLMLGLGAFLMQIAVQGAWGVVPAHLNELSPAEVRGTFPGFAYQLGNLFASYNIVLQSKIAHAYSGNYSIALASVVGVTLFLLAGLAFIGRENREADLGHKPQL
jgi:SHS family lactate transporter-like MFS transporter